MPLSILRHMRNAASQMAYGSFFYNWSLGGDTPERLIVKPVDPWPGDKEAGRWLCEGAFVVNDEQLQLCGDCWEPLGVDEAWLTHMHSFEWLRDLRMLGEEHARRQARAMVENWILRYEGWNPKIWAPDITGRRIAMWIAHYEFFAAHADEDFLDLFFESLIRQSRHLSRALPGSLYGPPLMAAQKALLYAGLAFEGREAWIAQALDGLEAQTQKQILSDGAHISRSPSQLLEVLQILLDVRTALTAGGYPLPENIQHAIDRMVPALRLFRYSDKHFGLFNGTQEGDVELIDRVIGQSGSRSKALQSLPEGGYERVTQGRTLLVFDCGKPAPWPYDRHMHAAPLAFEMAYGKDRVFVSCGTHPTCPEWQDSLRATAAHNTLTVGSRNACEILESGHFARKPRTSISLREDNQKACLLEGTHDGYLTLNGITHKRRLYLSDGGHDLRGEDILSCKTDLAQRLDFEARFHIHPRVVVSLTRDGDEALLRLPNGVGWRFYQAGGVLALEDSIYLGQGSRPRKTKQLIIYGQIIDNETKIKWAMQREGV